MNEAIGGEYVLKETRTGTSGCSSGHGWGLLKNKINTDHASNTSVLKLLVCTFLVGLVFPLFSHAQTVVPAFSVPDTVCVNTPVPITNTSTGATNYYWNFCLADVSGTPTAVNLGNPGGYFTMPVFSELVQDNGNYYVFVVNHGPSGIVRLDFGNSLLNTPTAVFLGNISGVMNKGYGSEGIQIIKSNGKWYGILVGGSPASTQPSTPKLITIYFGTAINNPSPNAVSWGNLGNMLQPVDLHVFQENNNWYGFTVNAENSTITRFNFTNSFDNPPTAVNLGNIGGLNYPTGVYAINESGIWRVFITNSQNSTLTRLDFGSSLLNIPSGVNIGNPGNALAFPRDITIRKDCGQTVGFLVNGTTNDLVRLNFNALTSTPTAISLGNTGNLNFPHSLSKLFRVDNDIYSFITNVDNNTFTRLKFGGCTNSTIQGSNAQYPPPVSYNTPGVYNINLQVDEGLPTQASVCRQVVVVAAPAHTRTQNFAVCNGTSVKIGSPVQHATYLWSTGAVTDSIVVNTPGTYWVESARYGCSARDSFTVSSPSGTLFYCDSIKLMGSDKVCSSTDTISYNVYRSPGCTEQYVFQADASFITIVAQTSTTIKILFKKNGTTSLKVWYNNNCKIVADSLPITVRLSPATVNIGPDISSCRDTALFLHAGSGFDSYQWQNGTTDSILLINSPGTYSIAAKNFCNVIFNDTIRLQRIFPAPFKVSPLTAIVCNGDSLQFTASGGTSYVWLPEAISAIPVLHCLKLW